VAALEEDLRKELATARERYELALAEMKLAECVYGDLGGRHPDGTRALMNANHKLAHESVNFQEVLKRFSEAVLRTSEAHHPSEGGRH
jgi:hypothetical protein